MLAGNLAPGVELNVHDGNIWTVLHLKRSVHEAVLWDPRIGVNEKDELTTASSANRPNLVASSHPDVTSCPCSTRTFLDRLGAGHFVQSPILLLGPQLHALIFIRQYFHSHLIHQILDS